MTQTKYPRHSRFKRGKMLMVCRGEYSGAVGRYQRSNYNGKNLVLKLERAFKQQTESPDIVVEHKAGAEITIGHDAVIASNKTPIKTPRKSGARLLLAHCIYSGYKIRATGFWLSQAVPKCPICKPECGCDGDELTVEWEGR